MVVISANAGGAWSPIGDVTTIMLWIGGQVTPFTIVTEAFLPSLVCMLVPLGFLSMTQKGQLAQTDKAIHDLHEGAPVSKTESNLILSVGVLGLLFVPVFKSVTHLPPFMGMLFSLSVIWILTEIIHKNKDEVHKSKLKVASIIPKEDTPSILFFLGILMAVASLQTAGHLAQVSVMLSEKVGNIYVINLLVGLLSSIVDNVPLVASAMGMYPLTTNETDNVFWVMLAYCAGIGGSALIIGSAAGVAIMGILKVNFFWYMK